MKKPKFTITPELLAPAGDVLSLRRAVMAGADAVYLGTKNFNARANAENFGGEDLKANIDYCHLYGVKVYVAFNTSIKEDELLGAISAICNISRQGADGIIIADTGLLPYLKDTDIPIHISTQAGVHNLLSASFFEKLGADRVVLSRESAAADIEEIRDNLALETEYFVQGALCVSFSGSCLMAREMGGGSGNRGTCSQPCRLKYNLVSGRSEKQEYMLSASDLCLLGNLNKLSSLGITSFKIEGRMRRPEYVGEAVRAYRSVLDGATSLQEELPFLKRAFNRGGYTEGYLFTDKVMSTKVQGHTGEQCGKVLRTLQKGGYPYAEVFSSVPLTKGDGLKILRQGVECGGADITSAEELPGGRYIIPISEGVKAGDTICLTTDKSRADFINSLEKRLPLKMTLKAEAEKPLTLKLESNGHQLLYESDFFPPFAESAPLPREEVRELLSRLGSSPFAGEKIDIITDNKAFVPKSQINRIRREGVEALIKKIVDDFPVSKRKNPNRPSFNLSFYKEPGSVCVAETQNKDLPPPPGATHLVYRPEEYLIEDLSEVIKRAKGQKVYLALPKMITNEDSKFLRPFLDALKTLGGGIFAENPGAAELAKREGLPYGGELNIFNTGALKVYYDADFLVAAYELSEEEALPLLEKGVAFFVKGYIPVMSFRHCPLKLLGSNCARCGYKGVFSYSHGKKVFRAVRSRLNGCSFTLYSAEKRDVSVPPNKYNIYINLRDFD